MFTAIQEKIHELEALLAQQMNRPIVTKAKDALEHAHDNLVHQVAEYVRTAEKRLGERG